MHASLLNEDLVQPGKLEMGISHRTGGRTRHSDWGRHETTPGWSATRILSSDRASLNATELGLTGRGYRSA
jgi:hypothetical protein